MSLTQNCITPSQNLNMVLLAQILLSSIERVSFIDLPATINLYYIVIFYMSVIVHWLRTMTLWRNNWHTPILVLRYTIWLQLSLPSFAGISNTNLIQDKLDRLAVRPAFYFSGFLFIWSSGFGLQTQLDDRLINLTGMHSSQNWSSTVLLIS